ncbi:hypothetical protein KKF34_08655 [Myxococcota bacterium]|nr:hypothetical protein [Myxococcota bacterium]MBU1496934.1 hypothetical protein [Myxococcota bacterium]
MLKQSVLLATVLAFFACTPEKTDKIENNDNNINNSTNNGNNSTNNLNNSNNTNTNNNTIDNTNIDNTNNLNNTTVPCVQGDCEDWEVCGTDGCVLASGRCYTENNCTGDQICNASHYCEDVQALSCNFTYSTQFPAAISGVLKSGTNQHVFDYDLIEHFALDNPSIVYPEPLPSHYYEVLTQGSEPRYIVMPGYSDNMPLFDRALNWNGGQRCYEFPSGAELLTEAQAYDFYKDLVYKTLGITMSSTPNFRNVVGIRGAYPGTFTWHRNNPDFFNDTLVLMWIDSSGNKRVKEFPVNTDTGDNNYSSGSTSSLLPNRMYRYQNGTHNGNYNALTMYEYNWGWTYNTADDANANGHWDNDRNGWTGGGSSDFVRTGSGHNIHMGSVSSPLGTARVGNWSAGCQVIPGVANWTEFITNAWTGTGNQAHYYLIDARDIAKEVWGQNCTPDGSHSCPWKITSLPYSHSANTANSPNDSFNQYGCSTANESGPEYVYEVKIAQYGTISVSVTCPDGADIDVHLLVMDDRNACLTRGHTDFTFDVAPGRYLIVADSWTNSSGTALSGNYTLNVSFVAD